MKFDSLEQAKSYLDKVQCKLNEYSDLESNLSLELEKQKNDINNIKSMQQEQRLTNHEIWSNQNVLSKEVTPLEEDSEVSVNDILNQIL